jgi:hypothetical protein
VAEIRVTYSPRTDQLLVTAYNAAAAVQPAWVWSLE